MIAPEFIAAVGMVAGSVAFVLGIAQLSCEHAAAPAMMRVFIASMAALSAWTAFDSWDAWAGVGHRTDNKAIAFAIVLACSWGYRRARGLQTDYSETYRGMK